MNTEYKCVTTVDGIKDYIGDSRIVAFDFETAPNDPYREEEKAALDPAKAHIVGCSFSVKEGTGVYVPVSHRVGTNIDRDAFFAFLTAFLMDKTVIKIAHNIAFESSMAYARGIVIQAPVYDTICASQMGQNAQFGIAVEEEIEPTMVAKGPGAVAHPVYTTSKNSYHTEAEKDVANTLVATDYKDPPTISEEPYYIVRRLTPTECARLQGFPDWWCDDLGTAKPSDEELYYWYKVFETWRLATAPDSKPKTSKQIKKWLTDPYSDSAEYKIWGNGVALPCVVFVLSGIVYYSQFPTE